MSFQRNNKISQQDIDEIDKELHDLQVLNMTNLGIEWDHDSAIPCKKSDGASADRFSIQFNQEKTDKFKLMRLDNTISHLLFCYIDPLLSQGANPCAIPLDIIEKNNRKTINYLRNTPSHARVEELTNLEPSYFENQFNELNSRIIAYKLLYAALKFPNALLTNKIMKVSKIPVISAFENDDYTVMVIIKEGAEALLEQLEKYEIYRQRLLWQNVPQPFLENAFIVAIPKCIFKNEFSNFIEGIQRKVNSTSLSFLSFSSMFPRSAASELGKREPDNAAMLTIVQSKLTGKIPGLTDVTGDFLGNVRLIFEDDETMANQLNQWHGIDVIKKAIYPDHCLEISKVHSNDINAILDRMIEVKSVAMRNK